MTLAEFLDIPEVHTHTHTQICVKCGIEKPISEFRRRGEGKNKNRILKYCFDCERYTFKVIKKLKKTAPPKPDACECCGRTDCKLVLDHDHKTNTFRGWICDNCNVALSRCGDTLEGAKNLVNYLINCYDY